MSQRNTAVLFVLFLGGLTGLWLADRAEIATGPERELVRRRIVPALVRRTPDSIGRLEIASPGHDVLSLALDDGRWRLTQPRQTLARQGMADLLVRSLIGLERYPGSGPIDAGADASKYGLGDRATVVRLFEAGTDTLLATLEIGATSGNTRYVRLPGDSVSVVEASSLDPADLDADAWRERKLLDIYSYDLKALDVTGDGRRLTLSLEDGSWKIRSPIRAVGDASAVNELLADVADLEAPEGASGFAAEDVVDLAPYGLSPPRFVISATPAGAIDRNDVAPRVAEFGLEPPDRPGYIYARRPGENDVMLVPAKPVANLGVEVNSLRSKKVLDVEPDEVQAIRVESQGIRHLLIRGENGWQISEPAPGAADDPTVGRLLAALTGLETAQFLDTRGATDLGLGDPAATFSLWTSPRAAKAQGPPTSDPDLTLVLGRFQPSAQAWFGQLAGDDSTALVLPSTLNEIIPADRLAFRDRTLADDDPRALSRIVITRQGRETELGRDPRTGGWKITRPSEAPTEQQLVQLMAALLAKLRAERLIAENPDEGDPSRYSLQPPLATIRWTPGPGAADRELEIGGAVPGRDGFHFGKMAGSPSVFTLAPKVVEVFTAEPRSKQLASLNIDDIASLELIWPGVRVVANRRPAGGSLPPLRPTGGAWQIARLEGADSFDVTRLEPLAAALATLRATDFLQYDGPIDASTGLRSPALIVRSTIRGGTSGPSVRLGRAVGDGRLVATTSMTDQGLVFLVPENAFRVPSPLPEPSFPSDPFAR